MTERERQLFPEQTLAKFKCFAAQLAEWDQDIVEVIAIRTSGEEDSEKTGKIDLVCTFDPEPLGDNQGYFRLINLLLRNDYEKFSQWLGIEQTINLGFVMGGEIYPPAEWDSDSLEAGLILWSADDRLMEK